MTVATHQQPRQRRGTLLATALLVVATMTLIPASPAAAHHGWDGFATDELLYISGTVSSEGNWGDPHSEFAVTLDTALAADTPDLPIPDDLSGPEDSVRIEAALAYAGSRDELEVIIAPPWWSSNNGLDRSLVVGERFQGVGYINRTDDGLFRPVAFWYGNDNTPVNQVIGNTLPVRAPLPGEASTGEEPAEVPSTIEDPVEMGAPVEDTASADTGGGPATWTVWAVFGAVVIVAGTAGILYVRRRTHHDERHPDA